MLEVPPSSVGGQRVEQFVRLKWADVSDEALTIFDAKGRPGQAPRAHQIPLLKLARADLAQIKRQGEFALSTTAGEKPVSVRTLAGWARDVVGDTIDGFQLKRIRSGVETLLAGAGVSREIRGHLQSHGLTGRSSQALRRARLHAGEAFGARDLESRGAGEDRRVSRRPRVPVIGRPGAGLHPIAT